MYYYYYYYYYLHKCARAGALRYLFYTQSLTIMITYYAHITHLHDRHAHP